MTVLDDARRAIPSAPMVLGLAGLIPFWGLALLLLAGTRSNLGLTPATLVFALQTYAAAIVSFLGGIRWGLATAGPQGRVATHYAIAVVPSLLAWGAFALAPAWSLAALGLVALAFGWADQRLVTERLAPPWFGRLRLILSVGAGVALLTAAADTVLP